MRDYHRLFEGPIKFEIIASELVERAHFISLLYRCSINTDAEAKLQSLTENKPASFSSPRDPGRFHRGTTFIEMFSVNDIFLLQR